MASVSVFALCAFLPTLALALDPPSNLDTGAPGKALTTGTVSSGTGLIYDGGQNSGLTVHSGSNDTVTATNATINNAGPMAIGLYVDSTSPLAGALTVNLVGVNDIRGGGAGVQLSSAAEDVILTLGGGSYYSGGVLALSNGGNVTIQNGANTILGGAVGLYGATTGAGRSVIINSTGGTIGSTISGIVARGDSGGSNVNIVIGQGNGVTSAITAPSTGILAVTNGTGAIDVRTGLGGTINGAFNGISANTSGTGAVTVNVGDSIGQAAPVTGAGVIATSSGGRVVIASTALVRATGDALYASTTGAGTVTINAGAVTSANNRGIAVDAGQGAVTINANGAVDSGYRGIIANSNAGGAITIHTASTVRGGASIGIAGDSQGAGNGAVTIGSAGQRLGGAITAGTTGVFAAGSGDVSVFAGAITAGTRGIVAASQYTSPNGSVLVDVTGPVVGQTSYGIVGVNFGTLATNTITIRAQDVTSTGGSGISAQTVGGDIGITTTGIIVANAAQNGTWDGIYAESDHDANITITAGGAVTGSYNGIDALTNGATTRGAITINAAGPVTGQSGVRVMSTGVGGINIGSSGQRLGGLVTGTNGAGVFASGAGDVNVYTGAVRSTGGAAATMTNFIATGVTSSTGYGIAALSSGGSITVNAAGTVTGGPAGGILAEVTGGTGGVTLTTGAVAASTGRAIDVLSSGGAVTINANGAISGDSQGIEVLSSGVGAITIHTASTVASGATAGTYGTAAAIYARNTGSGVVNIGTADQRLGGAITSGGTGLFGASAGDVNVYAGAVTGATRGIVAASQYTSPNGSVLVDVTGPVVGQTSYGIVGVNFGTLATNTITIRAQDVTSTGGSGISAQTVGGDIGITTTGIIVANAAQNGTWDGIYAESDHDANITITAGGAVTGSYNGIDALTNGATTRGAITINAAGPVTGQSGVRVMSTGVGGINIGSSGQRLGGLVTGTNGAGVFASGAGDVNVYTGAVRSTGGAAATMTNFIATGVTSSTGYGIAALSSGGSITVNAAGTVTGGPAGGILAEVTGGTGGVTLTTGAVAASTGRAIDVLSSGGAVTINANGAISGDSQGIEVLSSGVGAITIHTASTVASGATAGTYGTAAAIYARNTGSGVVNIGTADQRLGGAITSGGTGLFGASAGDVNVYAGAVTGATRGIVAASQYTSPNGSVLVDVTGPVVGQTSYGIVGVNFGTLATNTITIRAQDVTSTGGSGISAQANGGDVTIASRTVTANSALNGTWDGIYAYSEGDSLISITTSGATSGTYNGIEAVSLGATGRSGISITTGGSVTGGQGRSAILANLYGQGTIAISTANGGLIRADGGYGILANVWNVSGANNIAINNLSAIGGLDTAQTSVGIAARIEAGNAGAIVINSAGGSILATNVGIMGTTLGAGAVNIGGVNGIGSAITTAGTGIYGSTTSGALTITTAAAGTISPGALLGIDAHTVDGAILINQAGDIGASGLGNTVGTGIQAIIDSGASDLIIHSTGGIYVGPGAGLQSSGIYAVHGGTGAITVTSTGVIDPGAYGVVIQGGSDVSYTVAGGTVEGDIGVYIATTGSGSVNLGTAVGSQVVGFNGAGITAVGGSGATTLVVNGSVAGATTGISAISTGAGSTSITTTDSVTSGSGAAIDITSGTGGLVLNVAGDVISAFGPAINATSAGGGVINIAANSLVAGRITDPDTAVINLNTASGSSSTVNVATGAVVQSTSGSVYDVALRATGGSVVVNNSGIIAGRIDFSALTGSNTGQLSSAPGTTFLTGGLSVFGAGDDNFVNAGDLATMGALTTFDFRGGVNTFTNSGTTFVGFNPVLAGGSRFTLTSLTRFNNSGTLEMMNGIVGDSIVATGSTYVGSGAARLSIDTDVGAPGSRSDTLTVGSSSGRTLVRIRDASSGFGSFNPAGILIVSGATHAGDFVLDAGSSWYNATIFGGALDKPGLFFSQLAVNGAGATVLVSAPKEQAYQIATLGAQAQTLWYATARSGERQADLRDALADTDGASEAKGGVWMDIKGLTASREVDQRFVSVGATYAYDASYTQDIQSVTVGVDGVRSSGAGVWAAGASAAYVLSNADFDRRHTSNELEGLVASGHLTFMHDGFFVAGTVGINNLTARVSSPMLAGYVPKEATIETRGASVETGFRVPFVHGSTLEPSVGFNYATSSIDDLAAAGTTFRFDSAESKRLSAGVRLSGDVTTAANGWRTRYNVSLRGVDELSGENGVVLVNSGPDLAIADTFDGAFGEFRASLVGVGVGGWSAFGDTAVKFNDNYTEVSASIGIRLRY